MRKPLANPTFSAAVLIVFALLMILSGAAVLARGGLFYGNYWGGPVFAPLAIAAGAFLIYVALFKWRRINEPPPKLRGKAARLAREADETRFPIEDYDKPWTP